MALAELSTREVRRRLGRLANLFLPGLLGGTNRLGAGTSGVGSTQLIAALDDLVNEVGALCGEQVDGPRRYRWLRQLGEVGGLLGLTGCLQFPDTRTSQLDEILRRAGVQTIRQLVGVDGVGHDSTLTDQPDEQARQNAR